MVRYVISEARVISVIVALSAFVVALTVGMAADNPAWVVLGRALASMLAGQLVGLGVGHVIAHVRKSHVDEYIKLNPIPKDKPSDEAMASIGEQTVENSAAA